MHLRRKSCVELHKSFRFYLRGFHHANTVIVNQLFGLFIPTSSPNRNVMFFSMAVGAIFMIRIISSNKCTMRTYILDIISQVTFHTGGINILL